MNAQRSGCPINWTVETLGDRWSLIVIRDLMLGNRRHFRELLTRSEEGTASNILADRLKQLEKAGEPKGVLMDFASYQELRQATLLLRLVWAKSARRDLESIVTWLAARSPHHLPGPRLHGPGARRAGRQAESRGPAPGASDLDRGAVAVTFSSRSPFFEISLSVG